MPQSKRPNILIFMNDQEQAHLTLPGHPCRTPHADRLASEGVLFSRCYTPCAHCCPSRATFQTGLYPSGHGVYNNICNDAAIHTEIYDGLPTWGEVLNEAGYGMQYSGKWHVTKSRDPKDCGWTERLVTCTGRDHHGRSWEQYRQGAARGESEPAERERGCLYRPGWGHYRHYGTSAPTPNVDHSYSPGDYRVVTHGLEGLRDVAGSSEPWCVFIGPSGPHDPYIVPEKYATMYDPAEIEMPPNWRDNLINRPAVYQRQRQIWSQLSLDEQREAVAHYWGYSTMQDDLLGLVLNELDETGRTADTLVLFMSDHGDYNSSHGLWMKGVPAFDEAYHIPCIARWPEGIVNPGRVEDAFVTLADFAPTFIDLAQGPALEQCHGRSIVPLLQDERPDDWPETFFTQMNGVELYYSQRVVQTDEWKYVHNGFDWDELYHLPTDPHEMVNLAPRPEDPHPETAEVLRDLCSRMWRFAEATGDVKYNPYPTTALAPYGPMIGME